MAKTDGQMATPYVTFDHFWLYRTKLSAFLAPRRRQRPAEQTRQTASYGGAKSARKYSRVWKFLKFHTLQHFRTFLAPPYEAVGLFCFLAAMACRRAQKSDSFVRWSQKWPKVLEGVELCRQDVGQGGCQRPNPRDCWPFHACQAGSEPGGNQLETGSSRRSRLSSRQGM